LATIVVVVATAIVVSTIATALLPSIGLPCWRRYCSQPLGCFAPGPRLRGAC
jgi:hypothetical protein